jgi:hypothetical protein
MTSLLLILSALAAPPSDPSTATVGNVFVCDFEEPSDRDFDGWPDGWTRARSRELPEFVRIGIVAEPGDSGSDSSGAVRVNHCLQIELNGGGAVVSSLPQPISPRFSFLLTLRLKTAGLTHDGAWATLSLIDSDGKVLQSDESPRLTSSPDWQDIQIGPIAAVSNKAAKAVVSLHLQPRGKHEDLNGKVWFDDLRIVRLPRMTLAANSPTGLFMKREGAELVCEVSGICVRDPQVRFELFDQRGERLAEHTTPLLSPDDLAKAATAALPEDGYAGHASWSPPLEEYGYYRVRAQLFARESEQILLDRVQSLAVLRPLAPTKQSEFGWTLAGGETPLAYGALATLLGQAGVGWAKMPVWYDARETEKADRIAWFAEQLSIQGIELVGILDQPPPELRAVFRDPGRLPLATVFAEPELWQPAVGPVMTRLSLKVHWWQLGDDGDVSFVGYPQLEQKIVEIKRHLEQYGQQIHVGLNWRWLYVPPKVPAERTAPWDYLSYGIEPPLTADEIAAYVQQPAKAQRSSPARRATPASRKISTGSQPVTRSAAGPQRWLLLPPLARDEYSTAIRVQDLVMRMIAAKIQGAEAIFAPQPLSDEQGIMNSDGSPGELLVPWRSTAMLIGGKEYLGPLQLRDGGTGHIFARDGRAVMAVWSDRPGTERIYLGDDIEQIDIWGRDVWGKGKKPPQVEDNGRQVHELKVGPLPTFVTGLSEAVARWQAALAFDNSQLSSVAGREQMIVVKLRNTFPQAVSGDVMLHAPKSWIVDSRPTRFKIAEGEELALPIPIALQADATSGPQPVRLDFEISGQGSARFSVYRTLQLGLDDVQVELTTRLRKNDGVLVAELHLTNLSDRPLSFECSLFAPGRRRETRHVINLRRDGATLAFVLANGDELIGQKLRLKAEEIGGARVLNLPVTAER